MLPGVKRAALALVAFAFVLTACDDDSNKSATKTTEAKGPPPPTQSYKSRPDLKPPPVEVLTSSTTAPGYIFFAPKMKVVQAGPMILDNSGQTVWFHPLKTKGVSDFKVQTYHGEPVLTWWRGRAPMGVGNGYYVISDQTYREIGRVYAGHKFAGDIHDFQITPRNTALVPVYHQVKLDLTQYGGPKQGRIFDGIVQEIDIPTGRVLFEWHSYPEVGLDESYAPPPDAKKGAKAAPWDYFHLNSIDVADDGNYILSARNSQAMYKLNRDDRQADLAARRQEERLRDGPRNATSRGSTTRASRTTARSRSSTTAPRRRSRSSRACCASRSTRARRRRRLRRATSIPRTCWRRSKEAPSSSPTGTCSSAGGRSRTSRSSTRRDVSSSTRASARERQDHGAGPRRRYVSRVPLRVAGSSGRSSDCGRHTAAPCTRAGTVRPRSRAGRCSPARPPGNLTALRPLRRRLRDSRSRSRSQGLLAVQRARPQRSGARHVEAVRRSPSEYRSAGAHDAQLVSSRSRSSMSLRAGRPSSATPVVVTSSMNARCLPSAMRRRRCAA